METLNTVWGFITTHKATLALAIPYIGRMWYSLKNNGGVVGAFRAILFGTNQPK